MCGGRSSILHYGPLIETNYLYAPTPSGLLNKSNTPPVKLQFFCTKLWLQVNLICDLQSSNLAKNLVLNPGDSWIDF